MTDFDTYLKHALAAATKAGDFLVNEWGKKHDIETKTWANHYGIHADIEADQIYRDYFEKHTPDATIFSEESSRTLSELTWIIDPIEGTTNYRAQIPLYATQVCLLRNREPILSVVHMPSLQKTVWAVKDGGAFCNGKRIYIQYDSPLKETFVSITRGGSNDVFVELIQSVKNIASSVRVFGATGVDLALVSLNQIPLVINKGSQIYDILPGAFIVQQAGGRVCLLNGQEYNYDSHEIVAGSIESVQEFLKVTQKNL